MVGQKNNLNQVITWKMNRNLPRFILIVGEMGSGRLTLAKAISKTIHCNLAIVGNSVEDVRQTIRASYTVADTTMYIFRNIDDMRKEAMNALLKITEEPPNKAYFVATAERAENVLETILNRATVIYMQPYTKAEIKAESNGKISDLKYIDTIGELKQWEQDGGHDKFIDFVAEVAKNLNTMYGTDVLQISKKLKCKDTENGYDCIQFIKTLYKMLPVNRDVSRLTTQCINDLHRAGVKKSSTVDLYLLEVRNYI